jgi:hypothetical protein
MINMGWLKIAAYTLPLVYIGRKLSIIDNNIAEIKHNISVQGKVINYLKDFKDVKLSQLGTFFSGKKEV